MTHRNYTVIKAAGGETPDPAVFCPLNGYNPNLLTETNGWYKVLEFQTNSPSNTTFDPAITTNAEVAWDYGDGYYATGAANPSHTYADSSTKTVKMYLKGTEITRVVSYINVSSDNIVGLLDLSNDAFKPLVGIIANGNALLTSTIFNSSPTAAMSNMEFQNCDITGTFNFSVFSSLNTSSGLNLSLYNNSKLTAIIPPLNPSGKYGSVQLYSTGLSGEVDLTNLINWNTAGVLNVSTCPAMTSIKLATNPTGTMLSMSIATNALCSGNIDISGFKIWTSSAQIYIASMPLLSSVTTSSASITGTFSSIQLISLGVSSLDLRKYVSYTSSAVFVVTGMPNMTTIQLPDTVSGTFQSVGVYANPNLTGTLDMSKFTAFASVSVIFYVHQNPKVSGVIFANTITGTFLQVRVHDTGVIGVLDLRMFKAFSAGAYFMANKNPYVTQVLLADSITGSTFLNPYFYTNPLMTYIDVFGLPNGFNSINNCFMLFNGSALPTSVVNKILYDINSKSVSGYSNRILALNSGTNAAPDTTSGGYDGLAAKAALIAKGISVSTN